MLNYVIEQNLFSHMNEAEIQSRIETFIRTSLPTFQAADITAQHTFSLKMGHHNVIIDGKEPTKYAKRAIYDILLTMNGKPFILLELKKPAVNITQEDINQGVSYARLTDIITPITVVTNGVDTRIIDTYTKNDITSLTKDVFTNVIAHGAHLAANDFKNCVSNLIENDKAVIFSLVNMISESNFEGLSGIVDDFNKPICKDFVIERSLKEEFLKNVTSSNFHVLVGNPYVGKTNFLYTLFITMKSLGHGYLYINTLDLQYSVLRKISNLLTATLRFAVSPDEVRNWLTLNFDTEADKNLIIVYDHLRFDINNDIKNELTELVDLFTPTKNKIIIATDNSNYQRLAKNEDRNLQTIIGQKFKCTQLREFSSEEYYTANEQFYRNFKLTIFAGGVYSKEYRNPRFWRIILSDRIKDRPSEEHYGIIPAIPGIDFIETFRTTGQLSDQIVADFKVVGKAYIENIPAIRTNPNLMLMSLHMALIEENYLQKVVPEDVVRRLINGGFLEKRFLGDFETVYIPKLPEILSAFSIDYLSGNFIRICSHDFENGYSYLMKTCEYLPFGELIAGDIIMKVGLANEELFSKIMNKIIFDEPKFKVSKGPKIIGIYNSHNEKNEHFYIDTGEDDKYCDNQLPYLILSHLCADRFGDNSETPDLIRFKAITRICSINFQIRRPDDIEMHEGLPIYEFDGLGSFVQTNIGFVEPIVQSLMINLINYPVISKQLISFAIKKKLYQVCHRLYIASKGAVRITMDKSPIATTFIEEYEKRILPEMMGRSIAGVNSNRAARRKAKHRLLKVIKRKRK